MEDFLKYIGLGSIFFVIIHYALNYVLGIFNGKHEKPIIKPSINKPDYKRRLAAELRQRAKKYDSDKKSKRKTPGAGC